MGKLLSDRLECPFYDGDDFHPQANIGDFKQPCATVLMPAAALISVYADKMRSGQALTDEDRWPWLDRLASLLKDHAVKGTRCVVACSALKRAYREHLSGFRDAADHAPHIAFVRERPAFLNLSAELTSAG